MYFWEHIVLVTFTPENWVENFRMNRETLCAQLRPHIQHQNTHLRTPISVEHHLAITLWCLSGGSRIGEWGVLS